ncbi:MAG: right-handed parallel beta-helix repeat-containing protein [Phycisphaerae bacterium]
MKRSFTLLITHFLLIIFATSGATCPGSMDGSIPMDVLTPGDAPMVDLPADLPADPPMDGNGTVDTPVDLPADGNNPMDPPPDPDPIDTDGDGVEDVLDGCPNDASKTEAGTCGCGQLDTDRDMDGIADCIDNCPDVSNPGQIDTDGDGNGDTCEHPVNVFCVKKGAMGTNDGTDWTNAYTDLQVALTAAAGSGGMITEIWVSEGIHTPAGPSGDRAVTFQLLDGVALYGGFSGTEMTRDERDPALHVTLLSGDLNGDDETGGDKSENSYHVVTGSGIMDTANTLLDGFVITGGNADGLIPDDRGGGMYIASGNPTLKSCLFIENSATGTGGGLFNMTSSPSMIDCAFNQNSAGSNGGGIFNELVSNPPIINCTFSGNSASGSGGGIFNRINSNPLMMDCIFDGNFAISGGGLSNFTSAPILSRCTFTGNTAVTNGGAIDNKNSNMIVSHCRFSMNDAQGLGGAIYDFLSSPLVTNCLFNANTAGSGAGIYNNFSSSPVISNSTFIENAANFGGGLFNNSGCSPSVTNCILWNNAGGAIAGSGVPNVSFSSVEGGFTGISNSDTDPMFMNRQGVDGIAGTQDDDLRLMPGSPAIDSGDNSAVSADVADLDGDGNTSEPVPIDLNGNQRMNRTVDRGAFESP